MPNDILYGEPPVSWYNLLAVRCFRGVYLQKQRKLQCRPELSEQCRRKTDVMDASARMRACIHAKRVRKEKIFLFLFTETVLCGALLKKNKQTNKFLGLKKLDSCSF